MAKTISVEIREAEGYLRVTLSGDFPQHLPDAVDMHARLHVLSRGSGHTRYLVDIRGIGQRLGIPAAFEYASLAFPEEPEAVRTAVVDLPEHLVAGRFFESLMQSRGRSFRLFTDESEALDWLLSGS
ncbi:SpoIIAA family protein [Humidesulfovibrio idahonensis]